MEKTTTICITLMVITLILSITYFSNKNLERKYQAIENGINHNVDCMVLKTIIDGGHPY